MRSVRCRSRRMRTRNASFSPVHRLSQTWHQVGEAFQRHCCDKEPVSSGPVPMRSRTHDHHRHPSSRGCVSRDSRIGKRMRVLSNEDVDRLLTMPECMAVLEEMYRDYAHGEALLVPRIDNLSPSTEPGAYYGFRPAVCGGRRAGARQGARRGPGARVAGRLVLGDSPSIAPGGGTTARVSRPAANSDRYRRSRVSCRGATSELTGRAMALSARS